MNKEKAPKIPVEIKQAIRRYKESMANLVMQSDTRSKIITNKEGFFDNPGIKDNQVLNAIVIFHNIAVRLENIITLYEKGGAMKIVIPVKNFISYVMSNIQVISKFSGYVMNVKTKDTPMYLEYLRATHSFGVSLMEIKDFKFLKAIDVPSFLSSIVSKFLHKKDRIHIKLETAHDIVRQYLILEEEKVNYISKNISEMTEIEEKAEKATILKSIELSVLIEEYLNNINKNFESTFENYMKRLEGLYKKMTSLLPNESNQTRIGNFIVQASKLNDKKVDINLPSDFQLLLNESQEKNESSLRYLKEEEKRRG